MMALESKKSKKENENGIFSRIVPKKYFLSDLDSNKEEFL